MVFVFNFLALVAVCATGVLHWFGVEYSFYWVFWWWDIPTHILGGLTAGLWAAAVSTRYKLPLRRAALFIIGLTVCVALGWEIWETLEGLGGGPGGYWLDTSKDIFDGTFGAFVAWIVYALSYRPKQ